MTNKLAPEYLCDLVPKPVSDSNQCNLRNKTKLQTINCRTKIYEKSFLPDTTKIWNTLPEELASANSLGEFKTLVKNVISENYLDLNYGSRFCQIVHCRLKLGRSDLNVDKVNRFISKTPQWPCGHHSEDHIHFLFTCRLYATIRCNAYFYINGHTIQSVLYGIPPASNEDNPVRPLVYFED